MTHSFTPSAVHEEYCDTCHWHRSYHPQLSAAVATKARTSEMCVAAENRREFTERPTTPATRHSLTGAEAVRIVSDVRAILWREWENGGEELNPDKEQDLESLEAIAGTLEDAGLAPTAPEPFREITLADAAIDEPSAPDDHSAKHPYGAFLLQHANHPDRTLAELHGMAAGAYEMAQDMEQVRSITANLKRAEEIHANQEIAFLTIR